MRATLLRAARSLERFLLPNACLACERPVGEAAPDALICGLCRSRLKALGAGCARCRQPLPPVGPCRFCAEWSALERADSAVWLTPPARAMVHGLKYGGYRRLAEACAVEIVRRRRRPAAALLVPVPLGDRRFHERGFNQAEALGRALARHWRLPVATHLLRRVRDTRTQTDLTPAERVANVADAFAALAPPSSPSPHPGRRGAGRLILLDDVLTTGATLRAAARSLQAAGWPAVGALTFARALPYEQRLEAGATADTLYQSST